MRHASRFLSLTGAHSIRFIRCAAFAAALIASAANAAMIDVSAVAIGNSGGTCLQELFNQPASSAVSCTVSQGSASASATIATRTQSVHADLDGDTDRHFIGFAETFAKQRGSFSIIGTVPLGATLVFHVRATSNLQIEESPSSPQDPFIGVGSNVQYALGVRHGPGDSGNVFRTLFANPMETDEFVLNNAVQTADGFDFTLGFLPTSLYAYEFDSFVHVNVDQHMEERSIAELDAQLIGIDAYLQGGLLASVVFDGLGGGILDLSPPPSASAPAPASLMLIATGLVALGFARRRKPGVRLA